MKAAAFGRLCVETNVVCLEIMPADWQPPSGGCVLKQGFFDNRAENVVAAAFGRLCVETSIRRLVAH